ncbi:MAG: bacteriocin class II family protein [Cyanobacteria bacterium J06581_3]
MDTPEVIPNVSKSSSSSAGQNVYAETAQVFFGRRRYFLLHTANQKKFTRFLEFKGHGWVENKQKYWTYDSLSALINESSRRSINEKVPEAALSNTFYEVQHSNMHFSEVAEVSERDSELLRRIAHIKKSELSSKNHELDVKESPEIEKYKKLSESGKTAIALATGGASLGAILGGIPGAVLGGAIGGFITFSSNRHSKHKRG